MIDLTPVAAWQLVALVDGGRDDQLDRPDACPDCTVGDLVAHVGGPLSRAATLRPSRAA